MRTVLRLASALVPLVLAATAEAQQRPPVRPLGAVTARSAETFASVAGVRALSNGAVLVNDVSGRRVVQFDPRLGSFKVVADSTSATANAYGGRVGSLLAYRGDSSIFVDPSSVSMLIIDANGKVARVMAIPRAEDAGTIGSSMGNAAFDERGRLVYRASPLRMGGGGGEVRIQATPGAARTGPPPMPDIPDSAFIVSIDLATRKVDTVGYIRTPKVKLDMQQTEHGFRMQSMLNPLPVVDDWAMLPDGSVAIVRGRDYHVDFIGTDGATTSAAKIPFDWQRLTDEDKVAFLDSVKAARERLGANAPLPTAGAGAMPGMGGGGSPQVMVFSQTMTGPGGGGGGGQGRAGSGNMQTELVYVPASDLPDYKPPFFAGSTRADTEGNLWIRTIPTSAIPGGPVYDVINRQGELVERVQIPENRVIIGFGPEGAVFLLHRDGSTLSLERASVR